MAVRALVTGGAGFVGSHLVRSLVARGDDVHVLVRPQTTLERLADMEGRYTLHRLHFADESRLMQCLQQARPEQVWHLAGETALKSDRGFSAAAELIGGDLANLVALLAALSGLRTPPRSFVRAGSIAEYGRAPTPYREHDRVEPTTAYGAAHAAATIHGCMLQPELPFPAITARLALVYGEGQSERFLVPSLLKSCLEGRPFHVRHPAARRDLIAVEDVVAALLLLAERDAAGETVLNVSTGVGPTMREVATLLLGATGGDAALLSFGEEEAQPSVLVSSPELCALETGWTAGIGWRDGLASLAADALNRSRQPQIPAASHQR